MHVVEFVADASSGGTGLFLDDPRDQHAQSREFVTGVHAIFAVMKDQA